MAKHFIKIDTNSNIIAGYSDEFKSAGTEDICITEDGGRQFQILDEFNPSLQNADGTYRFRYIDDKVVRA